MRIEANKCNLTDKEPDTQWGYSVDFTSSKDKRYPPFFPIFTPETC